MVTDMLDRKSDATRQPANGIQVINRAARILRSLRDEPAGLSLGQIAGRVDLPRSTVQRIVNALVAEGLLMTTAPGGHVRLGLEILALAASSRIDVVEIAHPYLKSLSEECAETVDLSVLRKDHLVFVDQVVGPHRLRAVSAVGEVFPLHSTANGKACLALLSDTEIGARCADAFSDPSEAIGKTLETLLGELGEVRRTGIAFDQDEHTSGISAVGTAFIDPGGNLYAISVPIPTQRFTQKSARVAELLLATRATLSQALGT